MDEYAAVTAEFIVEDDQLQTAVRKLREAARKADYDPNELEIVVTHLGGDAWPPPPGITSTRLRPS